MQSQALAKLLVVLHFLGKASYQMMSGNSAGVSQASFLGVFGRLLEGFREIAPTFIYMPASRQGSYERRLLWHDFNAQHNGCYRLHPFSPLSPKHKGVFLPELKELPNDEPTGDVPQPDAYQGCGNPDSWGQ